jgi:hypothetical protein
MVRVHGVKEDLGLESIAGEDESCLLLVSTSEQLQSLNVSSVGGVGSSLKKNKDGVP